jgi:beta-galactosidase/beta-glucuronidase
MDNHAYPRPQLVRQNWTSLNGLWDFTFDNDKQYNVNNVNFNQKINVPFAPETKLSGIGDTNFHKICWYSRNFNYVKSKDKTILHFGAIDYYCKVWVNNHFIGEHTGGHSSFSFDITSALLENGDQKIVIYVEDDPQDLAKPRGKQDWEIDPHSIWYPRTTGIWQTVWLENVPQTYIKKLKWTPLFESFELGLDLLLNDKKSNSLWAKVKIFHKEQVIAEDMYRITENSLHRKISLADPGIDNYRQELVWSPHNPNLLDVEISLLEQLNEEFHTIEEISSYTALRSVTISRDRFMLNGNPYLLRLVLDQGYWPDSFMTAPSDEDLKKDVLLAKEMGFNGVRKHQKIEDPRYLYWADKLGLFVWEEMPSAYSFSPQAISRMISEWTEIMERDYSHPCIIAWVPFNESWGVPNLETNNAHRSAVQALYHLTKTYDTTRPVIGNDGWEATSTDIIAIHDYDLNPSTLYARYQEPRDILFERRRPGHRILTLDGYPHKGQPVMLTEFGGIAFGKGDIWGYGKVSKESDLLKLYGEILQVVYRSDLFSGFCYTQFTDTFQEANGLLYMDRTPKIPLEEIRKITTNTK